MAIKLRNDPLPAPEERFLKRETLDRPKKRAVSIRLDEDIIAHFRKGGPGWQTRVNNALRKLLP